MNNITKLYNSLTKKNNNGVNGHLEDLTKDFEPYDIEGKMIETDFRKQFLCRSGKNITIRFITEKRKKHQAIDASVIFNDTGFLEIVYEEKSESNNNIQELSEKEYESLNGNIVTEKGTYIFKKVENILQIDYYLQETLDEAEEHLAMAIPDESVDIEYPKNIDAFVLANMIIMDNIIISKINNHSARKRENQNGKNY